MQRGLVQVEVYCICSGWLQGGEVVAQLVPAGSEISEISQHSISGDAGGCETSVPEDAESATAPSQNTECEDLELTTCLGSWYLPLGTRGKDTFYCSSCLAPQHGDLFLPLSYAGTLCSCVTSRCLLHALSYPFSLHPINFMR